jgi:hypothetical protein
LWTALGGKPSNRKYGIFLCEYPLHWVILTQKKRTRTLFSGSTLLKHGRHFDSWNQPLNMRICVCYLDCHEARLCCYLLILRKTYYTHYNCFISMCDLFSDSPS